MDLIELKEIATKHFSKLNISAAIIGSKSNKDLDLFILNNDKNSIGISNTVQFLDQLQLFQSETACEIMVKHEHRNWLNEDKRLVHLLFYPTLSHLMCWELPSFISCVYQRGEFFLGDKNVLKEIYSNYRLRDVKQEFDILTYQLLIYMDLTITSLVYLYANSNIYSVKTYWENLQYVYRYTLRELFVSKLEIDEGIVFWEKQELIQYINEFYPKYKSIAHLLNSDVSEFKAMTESNIKTLFIEHLRLCKKKLTDFDMSNIDQIIGDFPY